MREAIPSKKCTDSICMDQFGELVEEIKRLRIQLEKAHEDRLFYATQLADCLRGSNDFDKNAQKSTVT